MITILDIKQDQVIYARMKNAIHEAKIVSIYSNETFCYIHYDINIANLGTISFEDFYDQLYLSEQDAINQTNQIEHYNPSCLLRGIIGYPLESTGDKGTRLILYAYKWDGLQPDRREMKWNYDVYKKLLTTDMEDNEYTTFKECKNSNTINIVRFENQTISCTRKSKSSNGLRTEISMSNL